MFERFTERARKVIILAREEAIRLGHNFVGTEHLLLGLIREGDGLAVAILKKLNVSISALKAEIEKVVAVGTEFSPAGEIPFTPQAKKVLEYAISEARSLSHNYIGTEHLLLGLIREGEGIASLVLRDFGVSVAAAKSQAQELLGEQASKQPTANRTPALDEFGVDLTTAARQDKLDPVIGRDAEIERVIQVLSRRKKNNPVLIGEAGVGKTAIVEGLALRIVASNVPETLLKRRVVQAGSGRYGGRHQVPWAVRGAVEGGGEGDPAGQQCDPLHRRTAHPGGGGRGRRRHRCQQYAETGAGAGRTPMHRRHHHGRVPQACRERPRARAPIPGHPRRAAQRGRDHPDLTGDQGSVRNAPSGPHHGRGGRGGGTPFAAVYCRSVPSGQGHRRDRRGRRPGPTEGNDAPGGAPRDGERGGAVAGTERGCHPHASVRGGGTPAGYGAQAAGGAGRAQDRMEGAAVQGQDDRDGRGRGLRGREVDRDSSPAAGGGRVGETPAHGIGAGAARGRAGRGHQGGVARHSPFAGGGQEPESPRRVVHLPGPHRGREDRIGKSPGGRFSSAPRTR